MSSFLKGRQLWRYATGEITKPTKQGNEDETKFYERLEEWDSKNHQILTWIRNITILSIKLPFGRFETAQEVWDLLCNRYSITDIAHQYQLFEKLSHRNNLLDSLLMTFYHICILYGITWPCLNLSGRVIRTLKNSLCTMTICVLCSFLWLCTLIMSLFVLHFFIERSFLNLKCYCWTFIRRDTTWHS